jgi:hypothetical protein
MLTHRLQVLLDDDRWERLQRESRRRHVAVGEIVREAIDRAVPREASGRRSAADRLLAAEPMPVPDDPADLKAEIRAAHESRFPDAV